MKQPGITFLLILSCTLHVTSVYSQGKRKVPSAYEIHQRFQEEKNFRLVSAENAHLHYKPSSDFGSHVVPADSAGQLVLNTWPSKVMESKEMIQIREQIREGKFHDALPPLQAYARKHKDAAPVQLLYAEVLYHEWHNAQAERIVDSLIAQYPLYAFAYRLKAEIQLRGKKYEEALNTAARARVLQAAASGIIGTFESVAARSGYRVSLKLIKPNYMIDVSDSIITVTSDPLWNTYAMCRCLWDHSENYATERGETRGKKFDMRREQECLLSMLTYAENIEDLSNAPEIRLLKKAVEQNMLQEFIMMELFLPIQPALAFTMKPELREQLEKYLTEVRVSKN